MFKSTFIFIAAVIISYAAFPSQITVSNDINRPAMYTNLQTAIDDAAIGDTLLIYGSSTSYGSVTVSKTLVLIGEGYNGSTQNPVSLTTLTLSNLNASVGASGSTIMGLNTSTVSLTASFSGSSAMENVLDDITFLRNSFNTVRPGSSSSTFSSFTFFNNIITGSIYPSWTGSSTNSFVNWSFRNNIMDGIVYYGTITRDGGGVVTSFLDLSGIQFINNLFLNSTTGLLNRVYGSVFEENIFFGHQPYNNDYEAITWNHNLFYQVSEASELAELTTNNGSATGNLFETNPLFTDYPTAPTAFSYDHDYTLQAGSPALTADVGGEEIGIYGGAYPFVVGANPPIPQITEINITDGTSSVPVGGTINFNFKAVSGN